MRLTALRPSVILYPALFMIFSVVTCGARASGMPIRWSAPPQCPGRSQVVARVGELTERGLPKGVSVEVEVTRAATGYRAHVSVRGPSGLAERELNSASCEVLADAVALLLALSLPQKAPAASGAASFGVSVEGQLHVGALPLPAAGIGGAFWIGDLASLRIELHGAYYVPQSSFLDATAMLGADFSMLAFGANLCRLWGGARLALGPCLGADLYYMQASGTGGMPSLSGNTHWWAPSLRLLSRVRVFDGFAVRLAVEGAIPVLRPRFVFPDVDELHRVSAVTLQVSLGTEVQF